MAHKPINATSGRVSFFAQYDDIDAVQPCTATLLAILEISDLGVVAVGLVAGAEDPTKASGDMHQAEQQANSGHHIVQLAITRRT